ncbi:Crp/Fnr family transcriptional regulator [Flavobacterium sp. MC2016-06]|uniref:Crp/Fnr family transcriptional regulator n=1 Tax=Flavobacterium sp. MC2016-06 TaxID=2676308 RepID=UPI0012BAE353|nr:Crp/Fnr family transcriptional regulator [Flavobacterium sp. MC2016-06]MBU3857606.1 Crp/Fnr family transcriptional regulator [Flavobacterium sp. MC2016-06]
MIDNDINKIRELILSYIDINELEWSYCAPMFKIDTIKKKDVILSQGSVCRNIYFVVNGLLRIYFIDHKGEEKTFHFSVEKTFATDYESFLKSIPSSFSIQAMEDTAVISISFDMLQELYKTLRFGEKLGRLITEDYFFLFNDKINAFYTQTPLERYNNMNEKFPKILQRVPQHYIASYLNISSVHLSRLK